MALPGDDLRPSELVSDAQHGALDGRPVGLAGLLERVAGDHGVGDPLAVLLVEDGAGGAAVDLVRARARRPSSRTCRRSWGSVTSATRSLSTFDVGRHGGDLGGRRPHGGGGDVLDPRARRRPARRRRARRRPRRPPAPHPASGAPRAGARGRPSLPVAAPPRRHALDPRPQGERRAGRLGGGDDRVARPAAAARARRVVGSSAARASTRRACRGRGCRRRRRRAPPRPRGTARVAGQPRSSRKQTPWKAPVFPTSARPSSGGPAPSPRRSRGRRPALLALLLLGRLREHLVRHVEDLVDRLRRQRVEHLAERAEARVDLLRLGADGLADQVGGLLGRDRREPVVDLRRARSSASAPAACGSW